MMAMSQVYFSDFRVHGRSLPEKLRGLMRAAGFESMDMEGRFAAVKLHFADYFIPVFYKAALTGKIDGRCAG